MSAPETDTNDDTHRVRVRVQARVTDLVGQSVGHTDILGLGLGWDLWLELGGYDCGYGTGKGKC